MDRRQRQAWRDAGAARRARVVGGPGSFVVVVQGRPSFARAIRTKLVREVAGLDGPTRVAVRAAP